MRLDPAALPAAAAEFLTERHLASLTTLRSNGTPHVVPVGFTFDQASGLARVITSGGSVKARNADRSGAVGALCSLDGARWLTLSGPIRIDRDPDVIRDAERRYAARYRQPRENPERVVLIMDVTAILGSTRLG